MSSPLRHPSSTPLSRRWGALARGGAVDRARLAVVPRLRSRAPRVPFVSLVSVLLLAGVVGLLLFNTSMQQASFTADRLEDEAAVLSARQQALRTEIDELSNPTHIAERACDLGMVAAPPAAFIDLATGKVTGTRSAAVAGPCPGASGAANRAGNR
ncbi:hypothetical protein [Nocardioides sp. GXZ039]|uniref:hypothetical protein n=1 Tax=Nocardioides sp. GXZ039 TaxID=3136018 RepID=UPI0030F3D912